MESTALTSPLEQRVACGLRWILGGLFIYAGFLKAADPSAFANDLMNYQLVPWTVAVGGALYLPWLETLCGAALIFGWMRAGALRILFLLMLLFLQALLTAWLRGLNIHCGCFGRAFETSNYFLLFLRDILLLSGFFWLIWHEWKTRGANETCDLEQPLT